ncbi:MAG: DUF488 domain-containing protein [Dysgonamonadaceae bacterium]|nr:DUF488 domain-containing protein [Dysgonamonadaceae bacterium]MEA5080790.1 DUF488 domain-containing protein [Dysgonamonadaceae bacterium]
MIKIKRIYNGLDENDGYRILVDRLWPRGISKENAHIDLWMKEISPSPELRKWYCHDPEKWDLFYALYEKELNENPEVLKRVLQLEKAYDNVTLLYAAKDIQHTHAIVIEDILKNIN